MSLTVTCAQLHTQEITRRLQLRAAPGDGDGAHHVTADAMLLERLLTM